VTLSSRAQEALDPNDIWYRGFLLVQSAQDLEGKGKYLDALNKLNEAKPLYDHLAQQFPDFQPEIVRDRRHLIAEKRDELKVAMRAPKAPAVAEAPAPAALPNSANPAQPLQISPPPLPGTEFAEPPVAVPVATNRTMEIESEGEFALPSWDEGASQALPRAGAAPAPGMPRVETRGGSAVGAIASSLHDDLSRKDALISWLNDENQKLRNEVKQREQMLQSVNAELTRAQASRDELMRRIAAAEGGPGGVEAQKKIEQLKGLLKDATDQLHEATERNEQLVAAMEQSQQEMEKMRVRMGELERERDNLLEVVRGEGNGGKALKELMDRNRVLTEQLDRAEQLAASLSELNQEKDDDIALLKSEITRIKLERDQLLAENARHQQSIGELQEKLAMLSDGLTAEDKQALASATPVERQENELLRSIVLKQLRRQAQMKQAKELLLTQLDRVGARSDTLLGLVEDMARGSQLSEEEKALFKAPQFEEIIAAAGATEAPAVPVGTDAPASEAANPSVMSATLIAPGNGPSPAGVSPDGVVEKQKLTVELAQIDKAARLDFKEGRYSEAEAGFLEYLHYLPQNVPCLCNLGVLKITMKNYSEAEYYLEKALAIDGKSGLANYLLGRSYFLQDKFDEALEKLEAGLTYDPRNAKAHNCVGVISTRKGWVTRAERAFTNAVSIDPEYGDAHFNLAVLYATKEQPDPNEAGKHYFRALHLGIPRDATIESFLKEAEAAGAAVGMR
jgi:tetratricopeptide (TPR) repeat protein